VGSALIARHYAVRGVEFLSEYVYFERLLFARDRFLWTLLTDSRLLPPSDATFVAAAWTTGGAAAAWTTGGAAILSATMPRTSVLLVPPTNLIS
jgi:hypothetical protein